ncbi:MAG: response regulator [Opitutales bacterium]
MLKGPTGELTALVVEDQPFNQAIVRGLLKQLGYTVTVVETGGEALEQLLQGNFALALIDCQLPDFDGYELVQRYRAQLDANASHTRLIALSAQEGSDFAERCRQAGMDACISKPVRRETLLAAMDAESSLPTKPPCPTVGENAAQPDFSCSFAQLAESGLSRENQMLLHETLVDDLQRARTAHAAADLDQVSRHAHRIKGALAFSKLADMEAVAASLESFARTGETDSAHHLLTRLEDFQSALGEHLSEAARV